MPKRGAHLRNGVRQARHQTVTCASRSAEAASTRRLSGEQAAAAARAGSLAEVLPMGRVCVRLGRSCAVDEGGCDVIGLVACAPQTVDSKRGPIRAGNLGHATNIANKLLRAAAAGSDGDGADADGGGAGISSEPPTITPPVPESVTAFVRAALAADARWASFE